MRRLAALAFLLPVAALAQPAAEPANPLGLTQAIGYAWDDVSALVAPPEEGAVEDGTGDLVWHDVGNGVERLDVQVRSGAIDEVTTTAVAAGRPQLAALSSQFRELMGEPEDGGFYTAAQLQAVNPEAPYLDVSIDPETGQTTLRKPSAPPPAQN